MKRLLALLAIGLATSAGAPFPGARYTALTPTFQQQSPPSDFTPAPTPNTDVSAPRKSKQSKAELAPDLFRPRNRYDGDGYLPGSTVDNEQRQRAKPIPGMNLSVPLN
jgi:hypothetical protein